MDINLNPDLIINLQKHNSKRVYKEIQKHKKEFWQRVLKELIHIQERERHVGFCSAIERAIYKLFNFSSYNTKISPYVDLDTENNIKYYKELKKYKPEIPEDSSYWFPIDEKGIEKRINIVKEILKEID